MSKSDKHKPLPEETIQARRGARLTFAVVLCSTVLAVGLDAFHQAVTVPSLPKGLFQQKVVVELAEKPEPKPQDIKDPVIEHTVDESDVKIESKPEPAIEPKPEPVPEVKPEPKPVPEVKPEPEPEPKPVPPPIKKTKVKPVPKPKPASKQVPKTEPVVEPQAPAPEIRGQAEEGVSGGMGGTGSHHSASSDAARQSALALIVDTIDANKSYPRRARQNGIEGIVMLRVTIDSNGCILTVDVKKKHASVLLNRAALGAAKKLIGMRLEGIGPLEVDVPVVFKLEN